MRVPRRALIGVDPYLRGYRNAIRVRAQMQARSSRTSRAPFKPPPLLATGHPDFQTIFAPFPVAYALTPQRAQNLVLHCRARVRFPGAGDGGNRGQTERCTRPCGQAVCRQDP